MLGISATPSGFPCLTGHVMDVDGTMVPGSPPAGTETLGDCPGGSQVASEDWGRATSVVAGNHAWMGGTVRVVVPIADEGPWCGDPVTDPGVDRDALDHPIAVCTDNDVVASPITEPARARRS